MLTYEVQIQEDGNGFVAILIITNGENSWTGLPLRLLATNWEDAHTETNVRVGNLKRVLDD